MNESGSKTQAGTLDDSAAALPNHLEGGEGGQLTLALAFRAGNGVAVA